MSPGGSRIPSAGSADTVRATMVYPCGRCRSMPNSSPKRRITPWPTRFNQRRTALNRQQGRCNVGHNSQPAFGAGKSLRTSLTAADSHPIVVSAVIPTRGRPELLCRAVRSALAQTLREIEVVVVIDGEDPATSIALDRAGAARTDVCGCLRSRPAWEDPTRVTGASMRRQGNGSRFLMMMTSGFRVSSRPRSTQ